MQQQQFWVGVAFAAVFVGFLMYTINKGKELNSGQRLMLKIMSALCAAIGGALISGEAFFNLSRNLPGGKLTVSGTAGFAIFFGIWFFFPKEPVFKPLPNRIAIKVVAGSTFETVADYCAQKDGLTIDYDGLTPEERKARLKKWRLETDTMREVIEQLGSITVEAGAVRVYEVKKENSQYRLTVKGG